MFDLEVNFDEDWTSNQQPQTEETPRLSLFRNPTVAKTATQVNKTVTEKQDSIVKILSSNNKPSPKRSSSSPNVVRRKFPGPAGLLPDKMPPRSFNDSSIMLELAEEKRPEEEPIFCSQTFYNVFDEPPFRRLRKDFDLDKENSPLRALTVSLIKSKNLKGRKIPFLALALDTIDSIDANGVVLKLRDQTGVLKGVVPAELWKEMEQELKCGAALVLKEVGIINYINCLNITKSNIVAVYTPENDGAVAVNTKQETACEGLARLVSEWKASPDSTTPLRTPTNAMHSPSTDLFHLRPSTSTPQTKRPSPSEHSRFPKQFRPNASPASQPNSCVQSSENLDFLLNDDDDFASFNLEFGNESHAKENESQQPPPRNVPLSNHNNSALSQEEATMVHEILADLDFEDFE